MTVISVKYHETLTTGQTPVTEQVIRDTLQVPHNTAITDGHARQAVLSAWLVNYDRTWAPVIAPAPAIIIHDEQPHNYSEI